VSHASNLTSAQAGVAARAGHLLVVPLGSTEQHGPHLPLTTDADIATAIAKGLAGVRDDVVVAQGAAVRRFSRARSLPGPCRSASRR